MPYKNPDKRREDWRKRAKKVNADLKKERKDPVKGPKRRTYEAKCKREWRKNNPEQWLVSRAKYNANRFGREFNLTKEDIVIPEYCPILGIKLEFANEGGPKDNSPSLDRIDNSKGYIKGNVIVVSYKANSIKRDANPEELQKIASFYADQEELLGMVGGSE